MEIITNTIWQDRRGNQYQVIAIAKDAQTTEQIVVYKQKFGGEEILCVPKDAFLVSFTMCDTNHDEDIIPKEIVQTEKSPQELMFDFLDTSSLEEKKRILRLFEIRGDLTDSIINSMAASMDFVIEEGSIDYRLSQLRTCVETRARYETGRLR